MTYIQREGLIFRKRVTHIQREGLIFIESDPYSERVTHIQKEGLMSRELGTF